MGAKVVELVNTSSLIQGSTLMVEEDVINPCDIIELSDNIS